MSNSPPSSCSLGRFNNQIHAIQDEYARAGAVGHVVFLDAR